MLQQKEENSPLWHVIVAASLRLSLFPPCSFFVLARRTGIQEVRGQEVEGQVPCFGQDPNIWLQGRHVSQPGLSCTCRRILPALH